MTEQAFAAANVAREMQSTAIWMAAFVTGLVVAIVSGQRKGLDPRLIFWTGVVAIAAGLLGAQALGTLETSFDDAGSRWWKVWLDGKSFYGGLIGGLLAAVLFLRLRERSVLPYLDVAMPAVALAYAIARVACFVNGDDFGTISSLPWAVRFGAGTDAHWVHLTEGRIGPFQLTSLPVHPVQLYSSLLGLATFGLLATVSTARTGVAVATFAVAYGIGRFALEGFRGDVAAMVGPLSLAQMLSLVLVGFGLTIWRGVKGDGRAAPVANVIEKVGSVQ
jgi:phosphatidylglycerol:prolipoprotein diacylglycerol transferase